MVRSSTVYRRPRKQGANGEWVKVGGSGVGWEAHFSRLWMRDKRLGPLQECLPIGLGLLSPVDGARPGRADVVVHTCPKREKKENFPWDR